MNKTLRLLMMLLWLCGASAFAQGTRYYLQITGTTNGSSQTVTGLVYALDFGNPMTSGIILTNTGNGQYRVLIQPVGGSGLFASNSYWAVVSQTSSNSLLLNGQTSAQILSGYMTGQQSSNVFIYSTNGWNFLTSIIGLTNNLADQTLVLNTSNTIITSAYSADSALSNAIASDFRSADSSLSGAVVTAYTSADSTLSNSIATAFKSADSSLSGAVVVAYTSADSTLSNAVANAFKSADSSLSGAVVVAYTSADSTLSNAVANAFKSADSSLSGAVVVAYSAADSALSNTLASATSSLKSSAITNLVDPASNLVIPLGANCQYPRILFFGDSYCDNMWIYLMTALWNSYNLTGNGGANSEYDNVGASVNTMTNAFNLWPSGKVYQILPGGTLTNLVGNSSLQLFPQNKLYLFYGTSPSNGTFNVSASYDNGVTYNSLTNINSFSASIGASCYSFVTNQPGNWRFIISSSIGTNYWLASAGENTAYNGAFLFQIMQDGTGCDQYKVCPPSVWSVLTNLNLNMELSSFSDGLLRTNMPFVATNMLAAGLSNQVWLSDAPTAASTNTTDSMVGNAAQYTACTNMGLIYLDIWNIFGGNWSNANANGFYTDVTHPNSNGWNSIVGQIFSRVFNQRTPANQRFLAAPSTSYNPQVGYYNPSGDMHLSLAANGNDIYLDALSYLGTQFSPNGMGYFNWTTNFSGQFFLGTQNISLPRASGRVMAINSYGSMVLGASDLTYAAIPQRPGASGTAPLSGNALTFIGGGMYDADGLDCWRYGGFGTDGGRYLSFWTGTTNVFYVDGFGNMLFTGNATGNGNGLTNLNITGSGGITNGQSNVTFSNVVNYGLQQVYGTTTNYQDVYSASSGWSTPETNEYVTRDWVELHFASGMQEYGSSNIYVGVPAGVMTNAHMFSSGKIPSYTVGSFTAALGSGAYTNGGNMETQISTDLFTQITYPASVSLYMGIQSTAGGRAASLHAELGYTYDLTNYFPLGTSLSEAMGLGTNLIQWTVTSTVPQPTNSFHLVRRLIIDSQGGSSPTVFFASGTNFPSHTTFQSISSSGGGSGVSSLVLSNGNPSISSIVGTTLNLGTNEPAATALASQIALATNATCLMFDGSNGRGQVTNSSKLWVGTNFCYECWICPLKTGNQNFIGSSNTAAAGAWNLEGNNSQGNLNMLAKFNTKGAVTLSDSNGFHLNQWLHIAATYDSTNFVMWVNGTNKYTVITTNDYLAQGGFFMFGYSDAGAGNCMLSNVRISTNTSRYASGYTNFVPQVLGTFFTNDVNTLTLWKCNDAVINTINDASGNGYNAQVVNGMYYSQPITTNNIIVYSATQGFTNSVIINPSISFSTVATNIFFAITNGAATPAILSWTSAVNTADGRLTKCELCATNAGTLYLTNWAFYATQDAADPNSHQEVATLGWITLPTVTASTFVTNTASITLSSTANGFTNGNYATYFTTNGTFGGSFTIETNNGSVIWLTSPTTVNGQAATVPIAWNFAFANPSGINASNLSWKAIVPPYTTNTGCLELRWKKIQ